MTSDKAEVPDIRQVPRLSAHKVNLLDSEVGLLERKWKVHFGASEGIGHFHFLDFVTDGDKRKARVGWLNLRLDGITPSFIPIRAGLGP
jgi:hypothetical protein